MEKERGDELGGILFKCGPYRPHVCNSQGGEGILGPVSGRS